MRNNITNFKCPHCGFQLGFDPGQSDTRDEPGYPAYFYCANSDCTEGYEDPEPPPSAPWNINTIQELWEKVYGGEKNLPGNIVVKHLERVLFKYTQCGCVFIPGDEWKVGIVGYTEGWNGDHIAHMLEYPFSIKDWERAVAEADKEGADMWEEVNREDENGDLED
jgi:hypothetical protein